MRFARFVTPLVIAVVLAAACSSSSNNAVDAGKGGGGGAKADGAAGTGGSAGGAGGSADAQSFDVAEPDSPGSMSLASTALASGVFLPENTCAGSNTSPPLTWMGAPAGTMSYAVSLVDLSIDAVHWVIWDIPMGTTSLPAALPGDTTLTTPVMAKQIHKAEFFGAGGAYRGPCPSGANHTYQFQVNAIGTTTLPGLPDGTLTVEAVRAAVVAASLAHGDLQATSNASAPPPDAAAGQ
jgi:Raf kinase inhibitor-like YbhB/YbcL family protein